MGHESLDMGIAIPDCAVESPGAAVVVGGRCVTRKFIDTIVMNIREMLAFTRPSHLLGTTSDGY